MKEKNTEAATVAELARRFGLDPRTASLRIEAAGLLADVIEIAGSKRRPLFNLDRSDLAEILTPGTETIL